jgi:predicted metal-dependent hydrolase
MTTEPEHIHIANLTIDVVRKDIRRTHLSVYPPTGSVRMSAPRGTDYEVLRLFALEKLPWIRRQIRDFEDQARETPRDYVSGESHYYQGRRYLLNVIEQYGPHRVEIKNLKQLNMYVQPGTPLEGRARTMKEWYRKQLKAQVPALLSTWQEKAGVQARSWGIKHMRTRWGTCNIPGRRIWLNLELAKKPVPCLEYIIVHELVHLLERHHNDAFIAHIDRIMPRWRYNRDLLNSLPLAYTEWKY